MTNAYTAFATRTTDAVTAIIQQINQTTEAVLFYNLIPGHTVPAYSLYIILSCLFCTIYFRFLNVSMFGHAVKIIRNRYTVETEAGYVTHAQAAFTSAMGSVGLGSVAGIAVGVSMGGPGSLLWMLLAGFLLMTVKFLEIFLGHKYREFTGDGLILGGPFLYIQKSLQHIGYKKLGKCLAVTYAIILMADGLGAANMFQANQTVLIIAETLPSLNPQIIALFITSITASAVICNMKKIGLIAEKIVPFMMLLYLITALLVIGANAHNIIPSLKTVLHEAFMPDAVYGSVIGIITTGFLRITFVSEICGGVGAIAYAPSKTDSSIRAGLAGSIDIIIPLCVCLITGLTIVITGAHETTISGGILITRQAFASAGKIPAIALTVSTVFLAVTTIITWSYYGSISWINLFGKKTVVIFKAVFLATTWYGCMAGDTPNIIKLCDNLWILVTIPNVIILLINAPTAKKEVDDYKRKLKSGLFKEHGTQKLPFFH